MSQSQRGAYKEVPYDNIKYKIETGRVFIFLAYMLKDIEIISQIGRTFVNIG